MFTTIASSHNQKPKTIAVLGNICTRIRLSQITKTYQAHQGRQGYNLCVDDDLKSIGMEDTTDVHVELIKLVYGLSRAHIPQHTVVQHQVIRGVKCRAVPLVIVGQVRVVESQDFLASLDVIYLEKEDSEGQHKYAKGK